MNVVGYERCSESSGVACSYLIHVAVQSWNVRSGSDPRGTAESSSSFASTSPLKPSGYLMYHRVQRRRVYLLSAGKGKGKSWA